MSAVDVLEAVETWDAAGLRSAVAVLVRVRRSAPRAPGARFAVNERGERAGNISSGCVEGDLDERLQGVLADGVPRMVHYGITDEMAAGVGLACGGEIDVLLAAYRTGDAASAALGRTLRESSAAVLFTGLSESIRARMLLIPASGAGDAGRAGRADPAGGLGEGLDEMAADLAGALSEVEGSRIVELGAGGPEVFAESLLPPRRLVAVGATPVAGALCRLGRELGIAVYVVDPREALTANGGFEEAAEVVNEWPEEGLAHLEIDRHAGVVALAHDEKFDVPALAAALRAGCGYVGQLGGGRTQRLRREALVALGFEPGEIGGIRGPVGLDIGAESPPEIALSILAEFLAVRTGRGAAHDSTRASGRAAMPRVGRR